MTSNKTFKDFMMEDVDVFFNPSEFAEMHELDGENLEIIIVDNASNEDRTGLTREQLYVSQESYKQFKTIYVKSSLFYVPKISSVITLDNESYYVDDASEDGGVIRIVLSANES